MQINVYANLLIYAEGQAPWPFIAVEKRGDTASGRKPKLGGLLQLASRFNSNPQYYACCCKD